MFRTGSWQQSVENRIASLGADMSDIDTRHSDIDSLISRCGTLETDVSDLKSRCGTIEGDVTGLKTRVTSLETWRDAKAPASSNMSTDFNLPTVAVLGLLSTPTKSGIEAALSGIASQVNDIKQVLRTRGIMNA